MKKLLVIILALGLFAGCGETEEQEQSEKVVYIHKEHIDKVEETSEFFADLSEAIDCYYEKKGKLPNLDGDLFTELVSNKFLDKDSFYYDKPQFSDKGRPLDYFGNIIDFDTKEEKSKIIITIISRGENNKDEKGKGDDITESFEVIK